MEANIADSSLFTQIDPEAIEKHCRRFDLTPEKKLMLAVLTDAIKTIRNPTRRVYMEYIGKNNSSKKRRLLDAETRHWFESPEEEWTFSFRHVCYVLGLDPDYVRRGVMRGKGKIRKEKQRKPRREAVGRDRYSRKSIGLVEKAPLKAKRGTIGTIVTRCSSDFCYLPYHHPQHSIGHPVAGRENIK